MHSRLLIEYDGSEFCGWSRQPGGRSVQAEVERALGTVLHRSGVTLTVAGRTDAGVHALGQVASYEGPPAGVRNVNALLPLDVAVISCTQARAGFDARRDATSRAYTYRVQTRVARSALHRRRMLHWPQRIEVGVMQQCAAALVGTHDFTAFTPTESEHIRFSRRVFASFWREASDDVVEFWIEADAFMRHMIRALVGTMLEVASGRRSPASFRALLEGRPRSEAGPTAPAHGLYLVGAGYGGEPVLAETVASPCVSSPAKRP